MVSFWGAFGIAVGLWFATGWYLNERLKTVHDKLDRLSDQFFGLREYLYEIDPQFDDERALAEAEWQSGPSISSPTLDDLEKQKLSNGYRMRRSSFLEGGFRAQNN